MEYENPKKTILKKIISTLISWLLGLYMLIFGFGQIAKDPVLGLAIILLSALLTPIINMALVNALTN